jgi:hypothetical protein
MDPVTEAERRLLEVVTAHREELVEDESFAVDVYRALTNRVWRRAEDPTIGVALSWERAEEVVDRLREQLGAKPLPLAQSGGEGELAPRIVRIFGGEGWSSEPLDTSRNDPGHVSEPSSKPPRRPPKPAPARGRPPL